MSTLLWVYIGLMVGTVLGFTLSAWLHGEPRCAAVTCGKEPFCTEPVVAMLYGGSLPFGIHLCAHHAHEQRMRNYVQRESDVAER